MAEFEFSIVINRPVEQVFAFFENPANMPLWFVGVQEAALIEGDTFGVGSKARGVGALLGRRIETVSTVIEYAANSKLVYQMTQPFKQTVSSTFESVNGSTRLTQRVVAEAEGFFKLAMPIMNGQIQRNLETSLKNLKEILEVQG